MAPIMIYETCEASLLSLNYEIAQSWEQKWKQDWERELSF